MEKKIRLEHAQHNEKACMRIDDLQDFPDWVITTAFYSAIHYIQFKIFPLTDHNGKGIVIYKSFVEYDKAENPIRTDSRHKVILKLVKKYCPQIEPEYRSLFDTCLTARYSNYKVIPDATVKAKEDLLIIKSYCNPAPIISEEAVSISDSEDSK